MTDRSRRLVQLAVLALPALLAALPATAGERFKLITANRASALERRLEPAAAEGYRLVGACSGVAVDGKHQLIVLLENTGEREAAAYRVTPFSGEPDDATVNRLGADGYRLHPGNMLVRRVEDFWLPESSYDGQIALIFEKPATPMPFAYDTEIFTGFETFDEKLETRLREGYRPLGLVNSSRRLRIVLEKALDEPLPAADGAVPYQMFIGPRNMNVKRLLNRAAKQGYRILDAADQSINATPMILMERVPGTGGGLEYEFMRKPSRKIRRDKLEKKLNKRTRKGYRLTPAGITATLLTLERGRVHKRLWEYVALSSLDAPGLPRALEEATGRGFRFVSMLFAHGEIVAVLERPYVEDRDSGPI